MKKIVCVLVCLVIGAAPAAAISGIELGVKGGIIDNYTQPGLAVANYNIDRMNLIGGQIYFSRLPMVDLIVGGDYSWRNETYTIAGQGFEFKIRDFAVTASLVYPINLPFASPYIGGGIGSHALSYEYLRPVSLSLADNGIEIPETSTFFGYHGIVGAKINLPALPLGFFIEGRLNKVNAPGKDISFNSWAGGIYLALP